MPPDPTIDQVEFERDESHHHVLHSFLFPSKLDYSNNQQQEKDA